MNLSVSPIPFPLVFSWLYVLHPNPIAKTPTDRQGGQPRSDHDDPATYEWGGSKNINPPYHLITQETILVKKRVVCCERWPTKFGLRKNPKCRSRRAVPALPPCATGGREAGRAIETVAFSTKVNGAAADGGKWERGGERGGEKKEARPNRTTCTHAHATTNGEGRGGRGLAQPAS